MELVKAATVVDIVVDFLEFLEIEEVVGRIAQEKMIVVHWSDTAGETEWEDIGVELAQGPVVGHFLRQRNKA